MNLKSVVHTSPRARTRRRLALGMFAGAIVLMALVLSIASLALAANIFPDVSVTHPHQGAIRELASKGIIGGYENGNFGPDDPVRRQQFAKMIVLTGVDLGKYTVSESDACPFKDVQVGGYADPYFPDNYVAVCAAKGITVGKTATTFDPYNYITRYQAISMVVRAVDSLQSGALLDVPSDFAATGGWANDPNHGANATRAEYNLLLLGLDLENLDPYGNMTRGEVAQVLHNLIGMLSYWKESPRNVYFYGLNVENPPLDNVQVRQALALAIDRQAIITSLGISAAIPATGWVPPSTPGFDALTQAFLKPTAQVDQAAALLADAGYPGGVGLPEIKIQIVAIPGTKHLAIANAVKTQWEAIGVKATVVEVPQNNYWALLAGDDVMVYRMGFIAEFNDAYEFLNMFRTGADGNYTRWSSVAYDQGLDASLLETSEAGQWAAYAALEEILCVDELPIIPIYWY